jgi:hypothetical protein
MTKAEAEAECRRLGKEDPDRERFEFLAREQSDGDWTVARIELPSGMKRAEPTGTSTEPPPEGGPPGPDENERNIRTWGGGA